MFKDFYTDFDLDTQILVSDGLKDPQLASKVGADLSNVRGTAPIAEGPGTEFFTTEYENAFGAEPQIYDGQAYDAAAIMLLANAAAGENDGAAVRDNMNKVANPEGEVVTPEQLPEGIEMVANGQDIDFRGASSAVDFDEAGDMKAVTYDYFQFTSDGLETVEKIKFKA
jgi:ABC-type branched-subunit amino acid transport system substrate-binding protein